MTGAMLQYERDTPDEDIPYDDELKCKACGRVGCNILEIEDDVRGDMVVGKLRCVICKCGECLRILEDDEPTEEGER